MEVKAGQTVIDVAMTATGRADTAIDIAIGSGVCLTDDEVSVEIGSEIETDRDVKAVLDLEKNEPATGVSEADETAAPYRGVGFWAIETDFEVQ